MAHTTRSHYCPITTEHGTRQDAEQALHNAGYRRIHVSLFVREAPTIGHNIEAEITSDGVVTYTLAQEKKWWQEAITTANTE